MNFSYPSQQPNLLDEIKRFFGSRSALPNLILINIAVWMIIQTLKVFAFFLSVSGNDLINTLVLHTLAVPASIPVLVSSPWTIFTYNFLHIDFLHILFNMMWLFWFGKIFLEFLKPKQLVWVYILGGISGGFLYVIAFNAFPVFSEMIPISYALGASASVMAIVAAISFYVPDYSINLLLIGRVRIGYLALLLFIFDFFMIPSGNAGGHLAHIGGALFGVVYILFIRVSSPSFYGQNAKNPMFSSFQSWVKTRFARKKSQETYYSRPVSDDDYNLRKKNNQKKVDEILEKISKGGYDSLTKEEKEFLFRSSKNN